MAKHNHDLGNLALNSGGAGGQLEQVAARHIWPPLPVPHPSIIEVQEDQVAVENPLQEDLIELGAEDNAPNVGIHTSPPIPRPPINDVLEDQAVVEAHPTSTQRPDSNLRG